MCWQGPAWPRASTFDRSGMSNPAPTDSVDSSGYTGSGNRSDSAGPRGRAMARVGLRTLLWLVAMIGPIAAAQPGNPVYVDDSPTAAQVLSELGRLVEQGNLGEAVSVLQKLLDDEARRLVPEPTDPDLYHSVRALVHEALLERGELLERYRRSEGPVAARLLRSGDIERVERSYMLTRAGLDAALALAERHLESARFEASLLMLTQLERHPDRVGDPEASARCARMLVRLTPYVDRPEVRAMARRWAEEAGIADDVNDAALAPIDPPASARVRVIGGVEPGPAFSPDGLLPRPLRSAPIAGPGLGGLSEASLLRGERLPADDPEPWVMPVLAGDLVLINSGSTIGAWDRVTLERRWQFTDDPTDPTSVLPIPRRSSRMLGAGSIDDTAGIGVGRGVVVGATAPEPTRAEQRDPQLRAFSLVNGKQLWSVQPTRLDPELIEGVLHGPPILVDDTVVFNVFTLAPLRRVVSSHLVGLDLFTGELRWMTLLGTSGVSPSQRMGRVAHASASTRGVVYRTDPLGLVTATDAHSGRPVWTHRFPGDDRTSAFEAEPWDHPAPIVTDEHVVALSPDQLSVLVLDRVSGELIGRRDASVLGWPRYLLRVDDLLVCVGDRLVSVPLSGVLDEEPVEIGLPNEKAPGRVQVAGRKLLVPTVSGVASVDPFAADAVPLEISLDYPGAPVGYDDQLVVVDGSYVHAYLPWATAERVLTERLANDPKDPDLALTYAELAYRAGVLDRIPEAADAALAAAQRLDPSPRARSARDRLFESLMAMLAADRLQNAARVRVQRLSLKQRRAIVERLGLAASSATQRVGFQMELGMLAQAEDDPVEAARAYQAILLDPELIEAEYSQSRHKRRAELAAAEAL
ncbi:MAG TPA: hypothetical protein ENJ00_05025, partial [Phycisphaerales bacterium]|nr:hypothetical protein [Phycisphaerales bacterium]